MRRHLQPDLSPVSVESLPAINALPTLCLDRAREHARRLARGEGREAEGEPGWLGGLPVAIKDLADVSGVRTTYGSPIYAGHRPVVDAGLDAIRASDRSDPVDHAAVDAAVVNALGLTGYVPQPARRKTAKAADQTTELTLPGV